MCPWPPHSRGSIQPPCLQKNSLASSVSNGTGSMADYSGHCPRHLASWPPHPRFVWFNYGVRILGYPLWEGGTTTHASRGDSEGNVGMWGCRASQPRCNLRQQDFYVWPRDGRTKAQIRSCGGPESYYYKAWGCETTGKAYWNPFSSWDWITVFKIFTPEGKNSCFNLQGAGRLKHSLCSKNANCNQLRISFNLQGKAPSSLIH